MIAVRKFMDEDGDEFLYPCAIHFRQLLMKETVIIYLNGRNAADADEFELEWVH